MSFRLGIIILKENDMSKVLYDDTQISSLDPIEAVRSRPSMYLSEVGLYGLNHLLKEVVTNSIDEFIGGFGNKVVVEINATKTDAPSFRVTDSGRGIPLGKLKDSVSKLHTSGKYADIEGKGGQGYGVSGGLNGVGLKLANFLSKHFRVVSMRDGCRVELIYSNGVLQNEKTEPYDGPSGTIVEWVPDVTVMKNVDISGLKDDFATYLEIMSYISAGIEMDLIWNKDRPIKYHSPNGCVDYFKKLISERKMRLIGDYEHIKFMSDDHTYAYDIVFGFSDKGGSTVSYVNGIATVDGGVHVSALYEALGVLTTELNKRNPFTKKEVEKGLKISGNEIRDCLFAVVIADKTAPQFSTQTKSKFTSEDYRALVLKPMKDDISNWILRNSKTVDKINDHLSDLVRAKFAAELAKSNVLKSGTNRTDLQKLDADKFKDSNKNNPELCELFICEGNSAATQLMSTRNRDYQAIYALRGKAKNVVKSDVLSDELLTLVKVLGTGIGENKNISKCRYNKIIITCDKDDDGAHIQALMVSFFNKYFPELVINGNIYIANPPLYTLRVGKQNIYINNYEQLLDTLSNRSKEMFELIDHNGNVMSDGFAKAYYKALPKYSEVIDECSKMLAIDPLILEVLVLDFESVAKKDFNGFEIYGFSVDNCSMNKGSIELGISKKYSHYYLQVDNTLIKSTLNPIRQYLRDNIPEISRIGLRFRGRKSKQLYSSSLYEQGKLIYNTLFGPQSKVEVKRSKGLGSMEAHELYETAVNPETRYLTNLRILNYTPERTNQIVESMFTSSQEKKDIVNSRLNMVES